MPKTVSRATLWQEQTSYLHFNLSLEISVLMKCFNGFCKEGVVRAETVEEILQMMGLRVAKKALQDIIEEVDEDGEEMSAGEIALRVSDNQNDTTSIWLEHDAAAKYFIILLVMLSKG